MKSMRQEPRRGQGLPRKTNGLWGVGEHGDGTEAAHQRKKIENRFTVHGPWIIILEELKVAEACNHISAIFDSFIAENVKKGWKDA